MKQHHLQKVLFIALIVLPGLVSGQSPYAGLPITHHYTTQEYRGGIQNWQMKQDSLGLLYIANNFGLLEYDGTNWRGYTVPNGTKVRSLDLDNRGRIYVGCQGDFGYFEPSNTGALQYTSLADSLPEQYRNFDETWRVYLVKDRVYFCTFQNIFIWEQGQFTVVTPDYPLEPAYLVDETLYVQARGYGLCKLEGNQLSLVPQGDIFLDEVVSGMVPLTQEGSLLISTYRKGLFILRGNRITPWKLPNQEFLEQSLINCVERLRDGRLVLGTQSAGLLVLSPDGEQLLHLNKGQGLENRTVLTVYQDQLLNLWVGMNNGLSYVELGSPFTLIDDKMGLPGTGYAALMLDNDLFLGTNNGLYQRKGDLPTNQRFQLIPGTRGQVYHISEHQNQLLMGHHTGAYRITPEGSIPLNREAGSWLFVDIPGVDQSMIGGTYFGLMHYQKDPRGYWQATQLLDGLEESSRVMEVEPEYQTIWMTHGYKGVYRIQLSPTYDSIQQVKFYGKKDGFPSNILINVFRLHDELVFTAEQGVYRYNRQTDRFEPHPLFTELLGPDYQIAQLAEDGYGNVYFISTNEVGMLRRTTLGEYEVEMGLFNKVRRLLNDDLGNVTVLENNEVLFGAKEGFVHYDPAQYKRFNTSFATLIHRISGTHPGDSVYYEGYLAGTDKHASAPLPYQHNSLRFGFAAPFFEGSDRLAYTFMLENFDENWSAWTSQTEKEYTNLPEGDYIFRVRSRNIYGTEGQEVAYAFTILPPWYRSLWAYITYGVSIFGSLILGFMALEKNHRRERDRMAARQEKELNQKETEIKSIAERSEAEITRLKNEKLEAEISHKNKELATSTMHLMNKNAFISGVKGNLSSLSKKSNNQTVVKELNKLVRDIDRNLADNDDWEHFQFHFDQVHGDFSQRIRNEFPNMTAQEMRLCAYLRLNLNTKEIAQLLNISVRGVEISRYRLRKKLNLERGENLQEFILGY